MMNTIPKLYLFLVLLWPVSIIAGENNSHKTIDTTNPPSPSNRVKSIGTAVSDVGNVTPISNPANASQMMRCWQQGILIMEQPVVVPPAVAVGPPTEEKVRRLFHNPDTSAEMLSFDFKNAFCFIK